MTHPIKSPRKLIETALPLDKINAACIREKSIRHGHPSTLHLYWARRPLAAARAVIWSQMVNDPSWKWEMDRPGENPPNNLKATWAKSRKRLFGILEKLVLWESTTDEAVLKEARDEIKRSWRETCEINADHPQAADLFNPEVLPAFHDPFAGGGALPLEAQRLGLESWASDLNPVAVLINKAMIEIPPKFANRPPIGPIPKGENQGKLKVDSWKGAQGLAEDVRRYGAWMREEAEKRIGHLYPKVEITEDIAKDRPDLKGYVGQKLTVIAWLWARTVKSPDPAFSDADVPLISSFWLSTKSKKESWVQPVVTGKTYKFEIHSGTIQDPVSIESGTKVGRGGNFTCLLSGSPISVAYIRQQGIQGNLSQRLMAIVVEGQYGRLFISPQPDHEQAACSMMPDWKPDILINHNPRDIRTQLYGLTKYSDLFTSRQLVALNTLSDLVSEARNIIVSDSINLGFPLGKSLEDGGADSQAYADAISIYLGMGISRLSDICNSLCRWEVSKTQVRNLFGRQAIPMIWDFAEPNLFAESAGDFGVSLGNLSKAIDRFVGTIPGHVVQFDASQQEISLNKVISTDPPYYDNIGYADLSDFFYVWLRRTCRNALPTTLSSITTPKIEELVATPYRHGGKENAETFFLNGMTKAMHQLASNHSPSFPVTIYYAFKQSESKNDATVSTGWETFLAAVIKAGFTIVGTWPMRTELDNRPTGSGTNALASSIVLVCRHRFDDAPVISRKSFIDELTKKVHADLDTMVDADGSAEPVAPVDLAQAAIGPGMGVYSKYQSVLNADGTELSVRDALVLINKTVDSFFGESDSDWDHDTKFCIPWFNKFGFGEGPFGDADTLSRSKNTSVAGLQESGVLVAKGGKVRLFKVEEYPEDWKPENDNRIPVWEALHHLIRVFRIEGQEGAGRLLAKLGTMQDAIRKLAYLLYGQCERAKRAEEARAYNEVMVAWDNIRVVADQAPKTGQQQKLDL